MQPGLQLLMEAHRCATQLSKDLWEFGLELRILQAAGLSHNPHR